MLFQSRRPRRKSKEVGGKQQHTKGNILVISWGGARWIYALGIMKAMEECNIKEEIDAIYWVSIWAIIWSVWANWIPAEEIFNVIINISITDFYWTDILKKSWGFVSNKKISNLLSKYLPKDFNELKIPFYAWCVDTNSARYKLFNEWDLRKIVLGSMSIPGIFPPVKYDNYSLVDWWVLNNFPVDIVKKHYPNHKIIWIALNRFQMNQKIKSAIDNLMINFEVIMRSKLLENTKLVDILFYRKLPISIISLDKKQMQKTFILWYKDWIKMFKGLETKK